MKVNLYKIVFSIILFLTISSISAQTHSVTGKVKDKTDGLGIPGVNVLEKGTFKGTITDIDGNYKITVSSKTSTLQFSFIGYKNIDMPINEMAVIDIEMVNEMTELDELVVIGYGMQKKKVVTAQLM